YHIGNIGYFFDGQHLYNGSEDSAFAVHWRCSLAAFLAASAMRQPARQDGLRGRHRDLLRNFRDPVGSYRRKASAFDPAYGVDHREINSEKKVKQMEGYCKLCPVCNGRGCRNQIPGPGAKGIGDTAIRNYDKWKEIRIH